MPLPPWLDRLFGWWKPRPRCIDFSTWAPTTTGSNPIQQLGAQFEVVDHQNNVLPVTRIWQQGAHVGLDCSFACRLAFPDSTRIDLTLVHFHPQGATLEALNRDGTAAGPLAASSTQNTPQTLTLTGKSLYRGLIRAPQNEAILLRFCWRPNRR